MSGFKPTPEQAAAIKALDGDVVVSAGAGSGKTTVLARRFAHAVAPTDGGGPRAAIDEILAITFTRKAAAELIERVRRVLVSETDDPAMSRRMDEAWISTIDSFCGRILRRHALEAGVDPYFRTISEVEAGALRDRALDDALKACLHQGGEALELVRAYGGGLRGAVVDAYERVRRMGMSMDRVAPVAADPDRVLEALRCAAETFRAAIEACGLDVATRVANHEACGVALAVLDGAPLNPDPTSARELLTALADVRFSASAKPKEEAYAAKDAHSAALTALAGVALAGHTDAFVALLRDFEERYSAAKRGLGAMDFADVAEATVQLFRESPGTARRYREAFKLLMIDEFQDTNGLQMSVIDPIRNDDLCVVGDEKQAIYAWRYADVELFRSLAGQIGEHLPLAENFRSHPDVLEFVNEVFSGEALFGESFMRLTPFREGGVTPGWPSLGPRVEAVVVDGRTAGALQPREIEARELARRVKAMVEAGVDPAGIVVLLRAMTGAPLYAEAIREAGVDVFLASGELFFSSSAVTDLRALFKLLVMPEDDEALLRVLGGPLVGLGDDALMALRELAAAKGRGTPLWRVVVAASKGGAPGMRPDEAERLGAALATLTRLRVRLTARSVADLLRDACEAFDYDLTLLASGRQGAREWRNVLKLVRMAAEWEAVTPGDPGAFIAYLDEHERHVAGEAAAPLAAEEAAVRIMSVHSAKGLEFPVVFFADLGRGIGDRDSRGLLVDRVDGTPVLAARFPSEGCPTDGIAGPGYERLREVADERSAAEELRIAYVACTRAKEALVLVGSTPASTKSAAPRAGTHLRSFFEAFGSPECSAELALPSGLRVPWTLVDGGSPDAPQARAVRGAVAPPVSAEGLKDAVAGAERLACEEGPAEEPPRLPETVSYSSLKTYDTCPYRFYVENVLRLGRFRDPEESRATELGTAVHAVLEVGAASGSVDAAIARFGLSDEEAARLRAAVAAYQGSEVAAEVRAADRALREHAIGMPLDAVRLVGSMDLIAWRGDEALVVDYKTGRDPEWSFDPHQLEAYEAQARCYALAAFAEGARKVRARFVFVEMGARTVDFAFEATEADSIRGAIEERVAAMGRGEYAPLQAYSAAACGECRALGGLCPIDPPVA